MQQQLFVAKGRLIFKISQSKFRFWCSFGECELKQDNVNILMTSD